MLTVKEFIAFTGYKKQTVYRYLSLGLIKSERPFHDRYLISEEEAELWKQRKEKWNDKKKYHNSIDNSIMV